MFNTQIVTIAAALCFTGIAAQAQQWPWQVSLRKAAAFDANSGKFYIDLPAPPAGRILTVEQVSVSIVAAASIYSRVHHCEIEAARPNIAADDVEPTTRALLPLPALLPTQTSDRTYAIVATPVRIHVETAVLPTKLPLFRVSCDAEYINNKPMTVTLVGYTTPKP